MFADNSKAEASRKSGEKERRTVKQNRASGSASSAAGNLARHSHSARQHFQVCHSVTVIEETHQQDWQTQVQQYDTITKMMIAFIITLGELM